MIPAALRDLPRGRDTQVGPGHFAAVVMGHVAVATDGVGTKAALARRLGDLSTVGIDAVAMCVNDLLCVGADPTSFFDYVVAPDEGTAEEIAEGVARGAELAGVDVPGGETAIMPGLDVAGTALGRVGRPVLGRDARPGDLIVGLPSSGVHANGLTLAVEALGDDPRLLVPTEIYAEAVRGLYRAWVMPVGMAHVTGGGRANVDRLGFRWRELDPLPVPPLFDELPDGPDFNRGLGFVAVFRPDLADDGLAVLRERYPTAAVVGEVVG